MNKMTRKFFAMLMVAVMFCATSSVTYAAEPISDIVTVETNSDAAVTDANATVYLQASGDSVTYTDGYFNIPLSANSTYTLYYFVSEPCELQLCNPTNVYVTKLDLKATGKTESITFTPSKSVSSWQLWSSNGRSFSYALRIAVY